MALHNVLIVDDEESLAFFLQQSLLEGNKDWQVETAGSVEEALAKLSRCRYGVIVADLRMPDISGLELIEAVRSIDPATRVILMTAYGSSAIEAEARRLQVYEYVTKPFKIETMRTLVRSALGEVAASRKGVFAASDERFEALSRCLSALRFEVGAQCLFLSDMIGQVIAEVGDGAGLDLAALASLLGGSFATALEITRCLGDKGAFSLHYHEGEGYDLYASKVGENLLLAVVFDKEARAGHIGSVSHCMKRAREELSRLTTPPEPSSAGGALSEGIGQSVAQGI
jgi:ActR/RegA family two-component response regulator